MRTFYLSLFISLLLQPMFAQKAIKLKVSKKINIKVPEPSDICLAADAKAYYMVSDNGYLYRTDLDGKILQKADYRGADFEGVWWNPEQKELVVSDESLRRFEVFDADLKHLRSHPYTLSAGRNEGVESGTFDVKNKKHIVFTEKNPAEMLVVPLGLNNGGFEHHKFKGIKEVSACTFYKEQLWILSDEARMIYQTNYPEGKEILARYKIPVINPEGLTILEDGTLVVSSDDLERLYYFKKPELK